MKKIVIVEDSRQTVDILKQILEKEGFEVYTAYDGVEGFRAIKRYKPDLVLLDLLLPKMSGFDICLRMSQDREIMKTPVIILSTLGGEKETFRKLKTFEIIKFMKKPYSIEELLCEVKKAVNG
ncbi:MAG: response regulator [Elusimicrobiales bacterium]